MADISDPVAVRVAQETRDLADLARKIFARAQDYMVRFQAQQVGEIIPDDDSVILDSGAESGARAIRGQDIHAILGLCGRLLAEPTQDEHTVINRIATNMIGG